MPTDDHLDARPAPGGQTPPETAGPDAGSAPAGLDPTRSAPTRAEVRRWRRNLADERGEAAVYRDLAARRTGEEREILLALAEAERRHEQHWLDLLGEHVGQPRRAGWRSRGLSRLARRFGGVFVLALAQRAETRTTYRQDADATAQMAADEQIHAEVVRGLATRGRSRMSGTFRAAVFGANDGLVSNLALVLGVGASGVGHGTVLLTGLAGLLAGALSMGAGEFVSVRSQRELLEASRPDPAAHEALGDLDLDANELALVYRARGMEPAEADARAAVLLAGTRAGPASTAAGPGAVSRPVGGARALAVPGDPEDGDGDPHEAIGTAWGAAAASFAFFASGAAIPVLPYALGLQGMTAVAVAAALVGLALLTTGAIVGLLSGGPPLARALRQLAIGFGAAAVTYLLGLVFGTTVG